MNDESNNAMAMGGARESLDQRSMVNALLACVVTVHIGTKFVQAWLVHVKATWICVSLFQH